jgi:hypothetical protein
MSKINNPRPDQDLSGYVPYTGATANVELGSNNLETTAHIQIKADNARLEFGTAQDASIKYDGTDLLINPQSTGTGDLKMSAGAILYTPTITWADGAANATVANGNIFRMPTSGRGYTVSNLLDGIEGQLVMLIGSGTPIVTFNQTGNIRLGTLATTYALGADDVLTLVFSGSVWYEVSRSTN